MSIVNDMSVIIIRNHFFYVIGVLADIIKSIFNNAE